MKHIKDIYPLVNEVRQRIIEKMRAENITVVQFCLADEDEYLEVHKGEDRVEDYYDYRDEHCPCVIWFDKYGSGEDLFVMSVSLTDGEHPYFVLNCDGENDNYELTDDEVAWVTMLNVYEKLEHELDIEDEPEKVWVFTANQATDGQVYDTITEVFSTEVAAKEYLHDFVYGEEGELAFAKKRGWTIEEDSAYWFQAYEEGYYTGNHTEASVEERTLKS